MLFTNFTNRPRRSSPQEPLVPDIQTTFEQFIQCEMR